MAKRSEGQKKEPRKLWSPQLPRRLLSVLLRLVALRLLILVNRISEVTLRLVRCVIRATACPLYLVHPLFHQDPVIVLLAASLATGDLSALKLFVPRVLEPKVFQVTDDYWSTTKVSLTFHLLIPRVISLKMFPKIQSRNLETLSLKMWSMFLVPLMSLKFLLRGNWLNPFIIGIFDIFDIFPDHRKYLAFSWDFGNGHTRYFQFTVLLFGLSSAPYIFTKLLKPLETHWKHMGFQSPYFLMMGLAQVRR